MLDVMRCAQEVDRRQLLLMDGTQQALDLVSKAALTLSGGVGGAWPGDESNWRQLLSRGGVYAPVIGSAVDNLLSDEDASFEGGTTGTWTGALCSRAVVPDGWHGAKSLSATATAVADVRTSLDVLALTAAGSQYSGSCWVKAGNAGAVGVQVVLGLRGDTSGYTFGTAITLTTTWQRVTVTKTFAAGDTTSRSLQLWSTGPVEVGDVWYQDAIQLEAGAIAHNFALNSRLACGANIASFLTAGESFWLLAFLTPSYNGNNGLWHQYFQIGGPAWNTANSISLHKDTGNLLAVGFFRETSNYRFTTKAVDGANMPANIPCVIAANIYAGTGVQPDLWLNAVKATGTYNAGAGARESAIAATTYVATKSDGTAPAEGAMLLVVGRGSLTENEITRVVASSAIPRRYRSAA